VSHIILDAKYQLIGINDMAKRRMMVNAVLVGIESIRKILVRSIPMLTDDKYQPCFNPFEAHAHIDGIFRRERAL